MDRRRHRLLRILSFLGAAAVCVLALWSAGLRPDLLFEKTRRWLAATKQEAAPPAAPPPANALPPPAPVPAVATPSSAGTDSSVSKLPQPLLLVSTSPGRNSNEGTARIGINLENPQTYVGGATLANGARLEQIHADHVVLERGGRRLKLYLDPKKNAGANQALKALAMVGGEPAPVASPAAEIAPQLTDVIRSMAHFENDAMVGLQLFPGQKSSVFRQLGLQSGDILTAIDGGALSDVSSSTELLQRLLDGAAMTATVRRGNRSVTLSLDGSIVAKAFVKPDALQSTQAMVGSPVM